MSKHIEQKENNQKPLRKRRPQDHTEKSLRTFCNSLSIGIYYQVEKQYPSTQPMRHFQHRITQLQEKGQQYPFRLFQEADLSIPPLPESAKKRQYDDDVKSTASQIDLAKMKNQQDIIQAIFHQEKPLDLEADSLFASQQLSINSYSTT